MKRVVLISIRPEHACNILNGIKKDELRRLFKVPCWIDQALIYVTKGKRLLELQDCEQRFKLEKDCDTEDLECSCDILNGKIVASFTIDRVDELQCEFHNQDAWKKDSCYEAISLIVRDEEYPEDVYDRYELASNEEGMTDEDSRNNPFLKRCCLSFNEVKKYMRKGNDYAETLFDIRIKDLVIFDKTKELSEFKQCKEKKCPYSLRCHGACHSLAKLTKAPQNYCYIEVE